MTAVEVFAPAKINLTLHVTGRREDGYHLLDSLVVFAPVGDRLKFQAGDTLSLTVEGPEARAVPDNMDNIALRAAALAAEGHGAAVVLTKFLPVASGIGGGSSDAAAALRGMLAYGAPDKATDGVWTMPDDIGETHGPALLALGADVPMCLRPKPLRARGIGERLTYLDLPPLPAVLVNPRVPVSTAEVFRRLESRENPPMPEAIPGFSDAASLIAWLGEQRNDLEKPAMDTLPEIALMLEVLSGCEGCALSRMSGSGGTCFGLFPHFDAAKAALERLETAHPDWWVAGGLLGDQMSRAMPRYG
jgi:4-diphosphocytidyl-2-C-methyl-D-erythritol kinase